MVACSVFSADCQQPIRPSATPSCDQVGDGGTGFHHTRRPPMSAHSWGPTALFGKQFFLVHKTLRVCLVVHYSSLLAPPFACIRVPPSSPHRTGANKEYLEITSTSNENLQAAMAKMATILSNPIWTSPVQEDPDLLQILQVPFPAISLLCPRSVFRSTVTAGLLQRQSTRSYQCWITRLSRLLIAPYFPPCFLG